MNIIYDCIAIGKDNLSIKRIRIAFTFIWNAVRFFPTNDIDIDSMRFDLPAICPSSGHSYLLGGQALIGVFVNLVVLHLFHGGSGVTADLRRHDDFDQFQILPREKKKGKEKKNV